MLPSLRYARTGDDVTIAYTLTGEGPPLVCLPPLPLSNVFGQWRVPHLRDAYERLGQDLSLIIYDGRGTGHSQRDVTDLSLEAMLRDLDAVVDDAGVTSFALLGYYFSAATAIAYAARHPDRVTRLILFGGAIDPQEMMSPPTNQALITLIERDWDLFIESATLAWMGWTAGEEGRQLADAFRTATTPAMARATLEAARSTNVEAEVGAVKAPALVLHRQRDKGIPLDVSQRLAEALPDGRLLRLEGSAGALFVGDASEDLAVVLDFVTDHRPRMARRPEAASPERGRDTSGGKETSRGGVFISASERQKEVVARPFKALLVERGLRAFIVSDEPRPAGTWTPEEKVDAYLDLSDAVVVFATADLEAGDDRYTRPNIGDEIGRARSKPHLRDRVCVLKEHGVTLPSNINPAYESLDLAHLEASFDRALIQLREWGLQIDRSSGSTPSLTR